MAFVEIQFPPDISYGTSGGPEYATDIVVSASGHEQRNIGWSAARARYNVAHGVKTQAQLDALIAFFRARKGKAHGFRFKDWTDYQANNVVLGTGNGTTTDFQLVKRYVSGGAEEVRTITKPVVGTVTVLRDGIAVTGGLTLHYTTGVASFAVPPANGVVVTASFEFDVPVRFDTDRLAATLEDYSVHSWADIPLIEVRG